MACTGRSVATTEATTIPTTEGTVPASTSERMPAGSFCATVTFGSLPEGPLLRAIRLGSELAILDPLTGEAYWLETILPAPTELWAPLAVSDGRVFDFDRNRGLVDLVTGESYALDLGTWSPSTGGAGGALGVVGDVVVLGLNRKVDLESDRPRTGSSVLAVDVRAFDRAWTVQVTVPQAGVPDDANLLLAELALTNPERTLAVITTKGVTALPKFHGAGLVDSAGVELENVPTRDWPVAGSPTSVRGWMDNRILLVEQREPRAFLLFDVESGRTELLEPPWEENDEVFAVGDGENVIIKGDGQIGVVGLQSGTQLWSASLDSNCDPVIGNPGWPGNSP